MSLYPLEFIPILKQTIWGGNKLKQEFNKDSRLDHVGESWELSCVKNNISIIKNGPLAGRDLQSVLSEYGPAILGEKVFNKTGAELPLLFKFIDAAQDLSVQVHPGEELAQKRHQSHGKTEMWYVLSADKGSKLLAGFKEHIDKAAYPALVESGKITDVLASHEVKAGDSFYIPSGRVHAIGAGIVVAEVQQTSDITYRIYDYHRKDANGKERQLHTQEALDAIDFNVQKEYKTNYTPQENQSVTIAKSDFFTVNIIVLSKEVERDLKDKDSFIVYMCVEGAASLTCEGKEVKLVKGDTVLIPASIARVKITSPRAKLLEVYI